MTEDAWRPYEQCLENESRASLWQFIIANWGAVNFDIPWPTPPNETYISAWIDARREYHSEVRKHTRPAGVL